MGADKLGTMTLDYINTSVLNGEIEILKHCMSKKENLNIGMRGLQNQTL